MKATLSDSDLELLLQGYLKCRVKLEMMQRFAGPNFSNTIEPHLIDSERTYDLLLQEYRRRHPHAGRIKALLHDTIVDTHAKYPPCLN